MDKSGRALILQSFIDLTINNIFSNMTYFVVVSWLSVIFVSQGNGTVQNGYQQYSIVLGVTLSVLVRCLTRLAVYSRQFLLTLDIEILII
jgi:hypothetical protein